VLPEGKEWSGDREDEPAFPVYKDPALGQSVDETRGEIAIGITTRDISSTSCSKLVTPHSDQDLGKSASRLQKIRFDAEREYNVARDGGATEGESGPTPNQLLELRDKAMRAQTAYDGNTESMTNFLRIADKADILQWAYPILCPDQRVWKNEPGSITYHETIKELNE
jgi:hypothetical protein